MPKVVAAVYPLEDAEDPDTDLDQARSIRANIVVGITDRTAETSRAQSELQMMYFKIYYVL